MTTRPTLLPAWKNVVVAIEAGRWSYGDLIPHDELQAILGLPEPAGSVTADQYKSWRFRLLQETTALTAHLLVDLQMDLRVEVGVGYRITKPSDQSKLAEIDLSKEIAKAFRDAARRIRHCNRAMLTSAESQENTDAAVRLAAKTDALRKLDRLPPPDVKAISHKGKRK